MPPKTKAEGPSFDPITGTSGLHRALVSTGVVGFVCVLFGTVLFGGGTWIRATMEDLHKIIREQHQEHRQERMGWQTEIRDLGRAMNKTQQVIEKNQEIIIRLLQDNQLPEEEGCEPAELKPGT